MRFSGLVLAAVLAGFLPTPSSWAEEEAAPPETLRFGCVSFVGKSNARSFELVRDYLAKALGKDIKLTVYPTYHEVIHDLVNENLDVAVLSPLVYLNAQEARTLHTLGYGVYRATGNFTYKSTILVPADSPVKALADLAGRRMAYVDIISASGYLLPKEALIGAGVSREKDVKATFYKDHLEAVQAVLAGKADAVATYDLVFDDAKELAPEKDKLRRLWVSDFVIPSDAFVATDEVSPGDRAALRSSLLSYYHAQESKACEKNDLYEGFVPGDENLYADLRRFLEKVSADNSAH